MFEQLESRRLLSAVMKFSDGTTVSQGGSGSLTIKADNKNAMNVTVEGHQWWWGFVYTDMSMRTVSGAPLPEPQARPGNPAPVTPVALCAIALVACAGQD